MQTTLHYDDVRIEDYLLHSKSESMRFTELSAHLAVCAECKNRAVELSEFVSFLLSDPEETTGHIYARHSTQDGTLFMVVTGSDATHWDALAIGAGRDESRSFRHGASAKMTLERWFLRAYPGHRCTNQCGGWK
jgi:hypothetical protein